MPISQCEALGIPPRLRTTPDKQILPFDDRDEILYRRVLPEIDVGGPEWLSAATLGKVFQPPVAISCNRSSCCGSPTDVLYNIKELPHFENYTVIGISIGTLENCEFEFGGEIGTFAAEHRPETCMYPHSEIDIYVAGRLLKDPVKPKTLRSTVRLALAEKVEVYHLKNDDFRLTSGGDETGFVRKIFTRLGTAIGGWTERVKKILYSRDNALMSADIRRRSLRHFANIAT